MSLLDSTEKIQDSLDSKVIADLINTIDCIYVSADQAASEVKLKILNIIVESSSDSPLRQMKLPKSRSELIRLNEKIVRAKDELVIEKDKLSDLIQAQRSTIHARDMKIRSYEIMLGWFVAELSKYKQNNKEDIEKFVELNADEEGSAKIKKYAIQFEL